MPPAGRTPGFGKSVLNKVWQDGSTQAFHPGHRVAIVPRGGLLDFQRCQEVIHQPMQAFPESSGPRRTGVFDFCECQKRSAEIPKPFPQGQAGLRLPRKAVLNFRDDGADGLLQITLKERADQNRMHDHFAVFALLGGGPGHEGRSFHEIRQTVIAAGDNAPRKNYQRILRIGYGFNGALQRFPIHAFAVNAKTTGAGQQKPLDAGS